MVTHGLLRALLEQREALGSAVPLPGHGPRLSPLRDPVRYRPCPDCQQLMNRKNFAGTSGIVVDVCALHGIFFDAGELPRVLSFVRHGGLTKVQAMLRNGVLPSASLTSSEGGTPVARAPASGMLDDLVDLAAFVVDVLKSK